MNKNTLKYIVSLALFVDVSTMAVLGLMLGFIIPRGGGFAGGTFLGLHRHQWADIHLNLSLILLVLLGLHVWQNWSWITQSTRRYFGESWKKALWTASGAWIVVLLIGWIIART